MPDERVGGPVAPGDADRSTEGTGATGTTGASGTDPRTRPGRRALTLSVSLLTTAALAAAGLVLPVPYAVNSPGPTLDVLGEHDGEPLITIEGAPTYDATGELRLTTVSAVGGPGYPASVLDVVVGWVRPDVLVQPAEDVYAPDLGRDELEEQNQAQMTSSQEDATVAALTQLGYEVPAVLTITAAVEGSAAVGLVQEGDVLTAVDGVPLPDYGTLVEHLDQVTPGDTVTLTVTRDGAPVEVPVVTGEADGRALIGVYIDPAFDLPVDVTIRSEDIGGPSAGTMFALGIIDALTPEDEADGAVVAGTGTISVDGRVGPIGGIRQKLSGASRDGASWFLAPDANCAETVGHVPDDLRVVAVGTLEEAYDAVVAIGAGDAQDLPTCTADGPSDASAA
ncbi:PDZ domain-containing protein [Cellulomonas marina]|uniref:endopeptidase La n=1 Tax=Cellulomonas marina TaxID=988821 RepID=A0A1I1A2G6_9CELL|nr:PDZ domain-containing protein [Cellulomonas marina]